LEIDYYSVYYIFLQAKKKKIEGGKEYLINLTSIISSVYHLNNYIEFLKKASLKRKLVMELSQTTHQILNEDFALDFYHYLNNFRKKINYLINKVKSKTFFLSAQVIFQNLRTELQLRKEDSFLGR
jgi:replicative DNA helicase